MSKNHSGGYTNIFVDEYCGNLLEDFAGVRGLYSNIFGDEYRGNLLEDFAGVEGNYDLWKQFLLKF